MLNNSDKFELSKHSLYSILFYHFISITLKNSKYNLFRFRLAISCLFYTINDLFLYFCPLNLILKNSLKEQADAVGPVTLNLNY